MRNQLLLLVLLVPSLCIAELAGPLSPFSKLIGGKWESEGTYQTFHWGVGQASVIARSFFIVEGKAMPVSEGSWYWHPGEQRIRGHFTAINMPVSLFDYTTTFVEDTMRNDIRAYDKAGNETRYEEVWAFTSDHEYVWSLYRVADTGKELEMSATYRRPE
jgi:hypothetical protein